MQYLTSDLQETMQLKTTNLTSCKSPLEIFKTEIDRHYILLICLALHSFSRKELTSLTFPPLQVCNIVSSGHPYRLGVSSADKERAHKFLTLWPLRADRNGDYLLRLTPVPLFLCHLLPRQSPATTHTDSSSVVIRKSPVSQWSSQEHM